MAKTDCATCGGFSYGPNFGMGYASCCDGSSVQVTPQLSCADCGIDANYQCGNHGGHDTGNCGESASIAPKKPRLTSGISRMRSATGGGKRSVGTAVNWLSSLI